MVPPVGSLYYLTGMCSVNDGPEIPFRITVVDNGKPSENADWLSVGVFIPGGGAGNDLYYTGDIAGGNIQMHKDK